MTDVIALAVITRNGLVLLGRRADGRPPWAFPGGRKIELGEGAEDAAGREALEETGLRVRVSAVIAVRIHPMTGARIAYVSAVPEDGSGQPAPGAELTEVGVSVRLLLPGTHDCLEPGQRRRVNG